MEKIGIEKENVARIVTNSLLLIMALLGLFIILFEHFNRWFLIIPRLESGITQEQLAEKLETKKSVISRMENHSEDIRLSTLQKVASVFGKQLRVAML